jgi:hypothetical protein
MRRRHKDAHNHHGDGPQRELGRRRLRRLNHIGFRGSFGLLRVWVLGDAATIFARNR